MSEDSTPKKGQDLVWEDPPASKSKKYNTLLKPLISSPGKWARIGEYTSRSSAYGTVSHLRSRRYGVPLPDHEWEFRSSDDRVYARYIGPSSEDEKLELVDKKAEDAESVAMN